MEINAINVKVLKEEELDCHVIRWWSYHMLNRGHIGQP